METELNKIKAAAGSAWEENREFRVFFKCHPIPSEALDARVHDLEHAVPAAIDCPACANGCKHATPVLENEDIKRLSGDTVVMERTLRPVAPAGSRGGVWGRTRGWHGPVCR